MWVIPYYAAVFALLFFALSIRVGLKRRKYKVALGSGQHPELERAIRVHGNFAEYVPFALLLIYFVEMQTGMVLLVHALALVLLTARLLHAYGVRQVQENLRFRMAGVMLTFTVMNGSALVLLGKGWLF
jgi:uncharacterized membrane protein YecN with MAPEG domain